MLRATAAGESVTRLDLRQLLENSYRGQTLHAFKGGSMIPLEPQGIWVVSRGVVLLSTLYPSGEEALLGLAASCMPFGLPLTLIDPYQAMALSDVDLMRLTAADLDSSPELSQSLLRHMGRRLRQTEAILALAGNRRIEDRLRQLLLLLAKEVGQTNEYGARITVRLTHQHLASAIGTTRVTITRLLGQMKRQGWLLVDHGRHIVIPHETLASAL